MYSTYLNLTFMYSLTRPCLFRLDPETAHDRALKALRLAGNFAPSRWLLQLLFAAPSKPVDAFGLTFKNPIGIAAGYDRDGVAIRGLSALGFGHVEIGTVTPLPQSGNPPPRVFRLVEDEALINRMGFPSRGSEFLQVELDPSYKANFIERILGVGRSKARFKRLSSSMLGINLGKNKNTPSEEAALDYLALVQNFGRYADYLVINVDSLNTAGLRDLQSRAALETLLAHIHQQRLLEQKQHKKRMPVLVKLLPDMSEAELDDAVEAVLRSRMDGIIVTNTTLGREGLKSSHRGESGGLSGAPLRAGSEAALARTVKQVNGKIPIVSVGGIMNPDDAKKRLDMGATLIQIYTGLIYRGPGLVKEILHAL